MGPDLLTFQQRVEVAKRLKRTHYLLSKVRNIAVVPSTTHPNKYCVFI